MLTAKDTDADYNVHPGGQAVGISDILVTFSLSATVVGETSSKGSTHVGSS